MFAALYKALIGKTSGPRAGWFLSILPRDWLARPAHQLTQTQQQEILDSVMAVLNHPDFASLFSTNARVEAPITGMLGLAIVSGQIDRLLIELDGPGEVCVLGTSSPTFQVGDGHFAVLVLTVTMTYNARRNYVSPGEYMAAREMARLDGFEEGKLRGWQAEWTDRYGLWLDWIVRAFGLGTVLFLLAIAVGDAVRLSFLRVGRPRYGLAVARLRRRDALFPAGLSDFAG